MRLILILFLVKPCLSWASSPAGESYSRASVLFDGTKLTLSQKAALMQKRSENHRPWFGLIASIVHKPEGGFDRYDGFSDSAIWTGVYTAAQALRYQTTGDPDALKLMEESLWGLAALHEITGVPGLIARCIVPRELADQEGFFGDSHWQLGTGKYEGWAWRGMLTNDQYDGYLFGLAAAWPYITSSRLRQRIKEIAAGMAEHVIANDLRIIDWPSGTFIDFRGNFLDQHHWPQVFRRLPVAPLGPANSLHGLHLMKVCAWITGDPRFEDYYLRKMLKEEEFDAAMAKYQSFGMDILRGPVGRGAVALAYGKDVKTDGPGIRSNVATNLSHMAFYDLTRLETYPDLRAFYREQFKKLHDPVQNEANSFWDFLYTSQFENSGAVDRAVDSLARFPERPVFGAVDHTGNPSIKKRRVLRVDYLHDSERIRWHALKPLPFEKRALHPGFAWQHNPYDLRGGWDFEEGSGADYLIAYWLGRSQGRIKAED
ncbi:MAG: hypothetical protein HY401_01500 [Elusimicrobia bacterium]|nr:hypothetical protein [Elusimicrobiota bacterium]